jgi:hypothetical protein
VSEQADDGLTIVPVALIQTCTKAPVFDRLNHEHYTPRQMAAVEMRVTIASCLEDRATAK